MTPIQWRSASLCPASCPANSHYDYCGPQCVDTCMPRKSTKACNTGECVEGCFCNEGFVWDGLSCVRRDQCGCTNGDLSYRIGESYITRNCNKKCTCVGVGQENCESDPCDNDEVCAASNFSRSGVLLNEPVYQCKKVKNRERPGTSFSLGQRGSRDRPPKGKRPKDQNKEELQDKAKETPQDKGDTGDDYELGDFGGLDPRGLNTTLMNDPFKNVGPEVTFPDCLPTQKWTHSPVRPDWIPPNQCCGNRPYNDMVVWKTGFAE